MDGGFRSPLGNGRVHFLRVSGLRVFSGVLLALLVVAGSWGSIVPACAQAPQLVQRVFIPVGKSITLPLEESVSEADVGSPEIVDAKPITDRMLYVQAKKPGTTNIAIFDLNHRLLKVIDVEVGIDAANLQAKIRAATGDNGIHVSNDNGRVVLSGTAADATAADTAYNVAKTWMLSGPESQQQGAVGGATGAAGQGEVPGLVNIIRVESPQQVMLRVRFLEVDRNAGRQLGININGSNPGGTNGVSTGLGGVSCTPPCSPPGNIFQTVSTLVGTSVGAPFGTVLAEVVNKGVNINTLITALETKGLLQRLAEPNLIALSGQSASFLAGGQFPVPTPAAVGVSAGFQFEPYGVQLEFRPTVLNNGIINLSIKPTVSELDYTNAVTISGTTVPALTQRTATTTVELRDGQSFAIAGLLQADNQRDISQLPWIGTVPVLGALFRSSSYQKDQTDLVIIVTPSLVQPAAPGARLATPFDNTVPSNDVDFFLLGQMEQRKKYTEYVSSGGDIKGPYGYMLGVMQDPPNSEK